MRNTNAFHNSTLDRGVPKGKLVEMLASDPEGPIRRGHNNAAPEVEEATSRFNDATDGILAASLRMNQALTATGAQTKTAVSKAKDQAAQLADALNRVTKVLGPDFDKRVQQLITLTDCLERLNALRQDGSMDAVLSALSSKRAA